MDVMQKLRRAAWGRNGADQRNPKAREVKEVMDRGVKFFGVCVFVREDEGAASAGTTDERVNKLVSEEQGRLRDTQSLNKKSKKL